MDILDIYSQAELDAAILPEPPVPLDPDYNGDGTVDAADYVAVAQGQSPDDTELGYMAWRTASANQAVPAVAVRFRSPQLAEC